MNKIQYVDVIISEKGGSEEAVRARVSATWGKWRDLSGVISDKKMPRKFNIKLYVTVVRPVLLYGAECWTFKKKEEQILKNIEIKMLRRIKGVILKDKVKSVDTRKQPGINSIQGKVREMRLRWYGHMQRMEETNEVRAIVDMMVSEKRPRARPKWRCMDYVRRDMLELRIIPEDAQNRTFWKSRIRAGDPTLWEKAKKKKWHTR